MPGVNIVYPISGETYPIMSPAVGAIASAFVTASFGVSCAGGPRGVKWGFDSSPALGSAKFYDQATLQFVHKLPKGKHTFWVDAGACGKEQVEFKIGP